MWISVTRPDNDYPLAYVRVDLRTDVEREDLNDILANRRLTLIGRWKPEVVNGTTVGLMAPVLIEDDHVKPRKKRTVKK
uniref:Uncharacterized protein n=1 Tax=Streptomyces phage Scarif TaxID=3158858 RepID=A0AAU7GZ00_9CAUD